MYIYADLTHMYVNMYISKVYVCMYVHMCSHCTYLSNVLSRADTVGGREGQTWTGEEAVFC